MYFRLAKSVNLLGKKFLAVALFIIISILSIFYVRNYYWKTYKAENYSLNYPFSWSIEEINFPDLKPVYITHYSKEKSYNFILYHLSSSRFLETIQNGHSTKINGYNGFYWVEKSTLKAGPYGKETTSIQLTNKYAIPDSSGGFIIEFSQVGETSDLYKDQITAEKILMSFRIIK